MAKTPTPRARRTPAGGAYGFADPTAGEERLIAGAKAGVPIYLLDLAEPERIIRPGLLRALCLDPRAVTPDGIRLAGARFSGAVDLGGIDIQWPLYLRDSAIPRLALRAKFGELSLDRSTIAGGVDAQGCQCRGGWFMHGAEVDGAFNINGANLDGQFAANGAKFRHAGDRAIVAQGVAAKAWSMDGAEVDGEVHLADAALAGQFVANGAKFRHAGARAIFAQGVAAKDWLMHGAEVDGEFAINGANLDGQFNARGAKFRHAGAQAIVAHGVAAKAWFMDDAEVDGAFNINGANLDGPFAATGAKFRHAGATAIAAQGVAAKDWFMLGAEVDGEVNISNATLDGQLIVAGVKFRHAGARAIAAQSVAAKDWFMRDGCTVEGAVDINSAEIGVIDFADLKLTACPGFAIRLDKATIRTHLSVDDGFSAEGAIVLDNAALAEARIDLRHARLAAHAADPRRAKRSRPDDPVIARDHDHYRRHALSAVDARIGRLVLPQARPDGIVDLSRAHIRTLEDFASGWPCPESRKRLHEIEDLGGFRVRDIAEIQHIVLDGAAYESLEHPDGEADGAHAVWQRRRDWLYGQHDAEFHGRFNPQPWRQLARTLAAQGFEHDARKIAIERRVEQRLDRATRWPARFVSFLLHHLADYGFNPWKAVFWSLAAIAGFGWLFAAQTGLWGNGLPPDFIRTVLGDIVVDNQQEVYPPFNPWIYSLDLFIPVLDLGMDSYWRPAAFWLYAATVAEQFIGAFLVALTITGFTGLLTRDEPAG